MTVALASLLSGLALSLSHTCFLLPQLPHLHTASHFCCPRPCPHHTNLREVAVDFSETRHCWTDMIRVWAIHDSHDRCKRALQHSSTLSTIIASHRRSMQVRQRLKLQQLAMTPAAASTRGAAGGGNSNQQVGARAEEWSALG